MSKIYKINGNPAGFEDLNVFHKLAQQFLPYAHKKLGFDKPVSVNLLSDPENIKDPLGKTAYYNPNKMEITLFVDKRHVKDILRSMAHELVHHTQNCRGEFDGGINTEAGYAQEDGHMRKMEAEAYLKGSGFLLRDWEDSLKSKKENKIMKRVNEGAKPDYIDIDGDGDEEETMKQAASDKKSGEETVEENIFAPNHYCAHHGGVQMQEGIKLGKVINHNWNEKLQKVTKYDMQFEDGTILEGVDAEDLFVTNASLAEGHGGHMAKRDDDKEEKLEEDGKEESAGEVAKKAAKKAGEAGERAAELAKKMKDRKKEDDPVKKAVKDLPKKLDKVVPKKAKENENWTRGNKDDLLFERLKEKWCK